MRGVGYVVLLSICFAFERGGRGGKGKIEANVGGL